MATLNEVVGHEVGVTGNTRVVVKPWKNLVQELNLRVLVTVSAEFSEPDLVDVEFVGQVDGIGDVLLESVDVLSGVVPVDVKEVNVALSSAAVEELAQPAETHLATTVRDCRGTDRGFSNKGFHVLLVCLDSILRRHVCLGGDIRLVEAEDIFAASGEDRRGGFRPVVEELLSPEHGGIVDAVTNVVGVGAPVVGPGGGTSSLEGSNGLRIVVGHTTLASIGSLDGSTDDRASQCGSNEKSVEGDHFRDLRL